LVSRYKRYEQNFRYNTRLTKRLKDKHTLHYYGIRIIPIVLVIGAIITLLYFYGIPASIPDDEENIPPEDIFDLPLPVVSGEGLTGENIKLRDLEGKPIVLEFMLSWCSHCQAMAPIVEEVYQEYGSTIQFLTIAGSQNGATVGTTAQFIRTYQSTTIHVFDQEIKMFNHFSVPGTPTYLFFNSDGTISGTIAGETTKASLIFEINKLS